MTDLDILARTIYGEARGEGREGMEAVALVIMNRYKAKKWFTGYIIKNGEKVPSVAMTCLKKAQFSCWNKNDPNYRLINGINISNPVYKMCLEVAQKAYSGELKDFTNGAIYYHTVNIKPYWAKNWEPCYQIKHHVFYREENHGKK